MRGVPGLRICVLAFVAVLAAARAAPAQVTTGFITGTVQDGQGGVIPGATVTLISEARGTRSAPTVTGPSGDFVFPNVSVDTYTIEVAMDSFKTLRRPGVAVSAGSRVAVGVLTIEIGVATETVEVKGEAPVIQAASGERSFTIPTEVGRRIFRSRNRSFTALAQLAPGVTGTSALGTRANMCSQLHHGRHLDDGHRQQHRDAADEHGVDCRGQAARVRLSGRIRPFERPAGHGGDEERDEPVPRFVLRRRAQLRLGREQQDRTSSTASRRRVAKQRDIGYSIGGPIGKARRQQQAVLLQCDRVPAADGGGDQQTFRVPTELERRG